MTSRREFLQVGVTGGVLFAVSPLIHVVDAATSARVYKAIFDERFPASVAFAHQMHRRGIPTCGISGDVTALWYHDLHFAWANAPLRIIGVTTEPALFCLETLARDAGHRLTSRETLDSGLVSWSIGPKAARQGLAF